MKQIYATLQIPDLSTIIEDVDRLVKSDVAQGISKGKSELDNIRTTLSETIGNNIGPVTNAIDNAGE